MKKAKEIVKSLHQQSKKGVCVPGGINTLVRSFTAMYYCRGIRQIVKDVLDQCTGTCKLSKALNTVQPAPVAIRTMGVMEEMQCDLITVVSKKGIMASCTHDFKYILTVNDCFSKYCWLLPLQSKEALPIATFLGKIFHEQGPPKYLHSDNGKEFANTCLKTVCARHDVQIKHGRPYHPQSQRQVENLNRRVKICLRHLLLEHEEVERVEVWPNMIKDIAYFLEIGTTLRINNDPNFHVLTLEERIFNMT